MTKHIIYLHGFNSSPKSEKAQLARTFFEDSNYELHVPALDPEPHKAIAMIKALIDNLGLENVAGFIGSSLGGYYSLFLLQEFNKPVVLINPAIRPYELLQDYLGENTNMYTGETYLVESHHMEELKSLEVSLDASENMVYLLVQTKDEVLDFAQATCKLVGARVWVQFGGDHAFQGFASTLKSIERFFDLDRS